jgi:hypothetical protein
MNPGFLVRADDFAAEVLQADIAVTRLGRRQLHAVDCHQPARLHDADMFGDQEPVVRPEIGARRVVPHVALRVAEHEQRFERRRID